VYVYVCVCVCVCVCACVCVCIYVCERKRTYVGSQGVTDACMMCVCVCLCQRGGGDRDSSVVRALHRGPNYAHRYT